MTNRSYGTLQADIKAQVRKELGLIAHSLYKVCGDAIADALMEEFEQLVNETAQYTGSTAASWNIGTLGAATHTAKSSAEGSGAGGTVIRTLPKGQDPYHAGHETAVNIALGANKNSLDGLRKGTVKAVNSGLNVWNDVPWAERAEEGPLNQDRNETAEKAFSRFHARVMEKVFDPIAYTITPEELKQLAKGKK